MIAILRKKRKENKRPVFPLLRRTQGDNVILYLEPGRAVSFHPPDSKTVSQYEEIHLEFQYPHQHLFFQVPITLNRSVVVETWMKNDRLAVQMIRVIDTTPEPLDTNTRSPSCPSCFSCG